MRDESSSLASALLDWLRSRAVDGLVCEPIRRMAEGLSVGELNVRNALAELARSGQAVPTEEFRNRVRVWRIPTPKGAEADDGNASREASLRDDLTTMSLTAVSGPSGQATPAEAGWPAEAELGSIESAQGAAEPVAPRDDGEAFVVTRVHRWIEQVGIHYDREPEVEEHVFGERGLIWKLTKAEDKRRLRASLLADQGFRARTLALWRGHRPTGERLEREQLERLLPRQPRVEAAAGAAVLRDMPTPTVTELAEGLTDEARDRLEAERRNGDAPDSDWTELDWSPPDF